MLPTFFVRNESNEVIKKWSDIDGMTEINVKVGLNTELESNIEATIETDNCSPGYLRLRDVGKGVLFRFPENMEFSYGSATISNSQRFTRFQIQNNDHW